jgi:hypothetical protein
MSTKKACESLPRRRLSKRCFSWAFAATCLVQAGIGVAEDGVRELRDPAEMAKVAPVRAIGIRLTPAVPIDPTKPAPRHDSAPRLDSIAIEPEADSNSTTSGQPKPKAPERIVPKPKVASSADLGTRQPIRIQAQAPIRFSLNSQTVVADSLPTPPPESVPESVKPSLVANAVATHRTPAVHPAMSLDVDVDAVETNPFELAVPAPPSAPTMPSPLSNRKVEIISETSLPPLPLVLDAPAIIAAPSMPIQPEAPAPAAEVALQEALETEVWVDSNAIETNEVSNPTVAMQIPSLLDESPKPKMRPVYSADQLSQAVFVELEAQSAREIQVDFLIQGILVGDEKICRAMARDGRVYLVGLKTGETIIEVQPVDGNPARLLRAKVVMPWQRSNGLTDLDPLLHAIQPLCPNGELTLRAQEDGSVVVKGKVDSQETAKRIMELTRKLILAPVVDKLEIR